MSIQIQREEVSAQNCDKNEKQKKQWNNSQNLKEQKSVVCQMQQNNENTYNSAACIRNSNQLLSYQLNQTLLTTFRQQNPKQTDSLVFAIILNKIDHLKTLGVQGPSPTKSSNAPRGQSSTSGNNNNHNRNNLRGVQFQKRDKIRHLEIIQSVSEYSSIISELEQPHDLEISDDLKECTENLRISCQDSRKSKSYRETQINGQCFQQSSRQLTQLQQQQYQGAHLQQPGQSEAINEEEGSVELLDIPNEYDDSNQSDDEANFFYQQIETELDAEIINFQEEEVDEDLPSLEQRLKMYHRQAAHENNQLLQCQSSKIHLTA
ncbi:hypothetical protein FGO68_gene11846 [Halteria grandinella]|uniref:Uncharacterized protein n=1 Tax=Halteria grandinella TaxID=5974 RepID=A0A8J8NU13_HALGN|nr:hypothetical protein FGO68_gene11846 [Halteria grandinella]